MSISSFNKGLDDAYMGRGPKIRYGSNVDYNEGYQMGEDINAKADYEKEMRQQYNEDQKEQEEEYYERLKEEGKVGAVNKHRALLNNCVDNDEAILHKREIEGEVK